MKGLPKAMFQLMEVPGIGAKTAYRLTHDLSIKSLPDLEKAAKKGLIAKLEALAWSQKNTTKYLNEFKNKAERNLPTPTNLLQK
jgi:DNA polymerase/3'-5' exonuclease PolX